MALTFIDIVNFVLAEIDEDEVDSGEFTDTGNRELVRVKRYVNYIYREIMDEKPDWSWAQLLQSFSTVAAQKNYAVGVGLNASTDLARIHYVRVTDSAPMALLPFSEFFQTYGEADADASGKPTIAYVLNDQLYLYPSPDVVYTVSMLSAKLATDLSAYGDTPLIPDKWRDVLTHGALWLAMKFENDPDAQTQYQMYQKRLQALRNADGQNHVSPRIMTEEDLVSAGIEALIIDE